MNLEGQSHHGFKRITAANWNQPDLLATEFGMSAEQWVDATLQPRLSPQIPEEVRALFETARALFTYSWYFYPMATAGAEQLERVMEAAARERCRQLGLPSGTTKPSGKSRPMTFLESIRALTNAGEFSPDEASQWEATRTLRNIASHPERLQILPPGITIACLITNAEMLNRLFK